ncbi:MAG: GNAT family N-acetyltransferase [Saprospiraceae bacterium]|nr:GNAT family N-acetyltransferase [Saprospiraceae bacterium]
MENLIRLISFQPQHIPLGMQLKSWAHWNQVEADWHLLLKLSSGGAYVATFDGKPVGTTITINYQQAFYWIGMVLVAPAYRGKGIGTHLLKAALTYALPRGSVMLDATALGQPLYHSLGFQVVGEVIRMECKIPNRFPQSAPFVIASVKPEDLPSLISFDRRHLQFDRSLLLADFFKRTPAFAFKAMQGETILGYCLGRRGSHFHHIGPIVAEHEEVAQALLAAVCRTASQLPLIIDVPNNKETWMAALRAKGFTIQRSFARMCNGEPHFTHQSLSPYAIAGPALG